MGLEWLKDNQEEILFFSQLVHDYQKLAAMRVMQTLREKWRLSQEDCQHLMISIFGRQMNEACYSVGGAMMATKMRIDEILPSATIELLKTALIDSGINDPNQRKDVDITLTHWREFLSKGNSEFMV